ncbi:MAG: hypothetical protein A3A98_00315 [Candidatus Staskawiczbacteria bacterium RIFCSPLOWO2_01_FULL_40_39]|uniref:Uncharacterized protein n=1 Tax=Candidatus Staskawiczbacteria bacterium RIFCSPHIGHO2_01_FULL_39_25 TaxID=1802202 RepID=A0A1G2HMG2_9BACT|nr:MAG: hypothetical protein A2730_00315 [Candidatus Staskawiczbacteria bacterium RIFCSPHIGHO2_01_FULL_39_25]OGZ73179.1 MAG: hypothetical protein A3A98_00315 [Candidatus Staskawiczbacteria bacterium RIFCSPLOWO2_01_FULL_40_39]OGZ75999.1 MAG: hypothetical protein A3I87_01495 [Candidatus Staskawiczbacteria bacterium RIFCSPLOWO2_02_FULL_39_8]
MEKINNQRIVFNLPEDTTIVEVIDEILKNNGLEENNKEFINKLKQEKEPKFSVAKDAAITLAQKKIPEKKLIELLAKHLETSKENAEKIVRDIKQKLIPYAKKVPTEEPLKKKEIIQAESQKSPLPYSKKIETANVEENAEKLQKARTVIQQKEESKGPDSYRETLD